MRPIVVAERRALDDWRELVAAGVAEGILENRVLGLHRAGVEHVQVRGRPGLRRIASRNWVAKFVEGDRSPQGAFRLTWRIVGVEART